MKKLLLFILCGVAATQVHSQSPAPEKEAPPSGPLLARAPAFARWNVTKKLQPASATGNRADAKSTETVYEFTKTGSIYLQQYTDALGRKWTNWAEDKIAATIWPGTGAIILQCNIPGLEPPDYTKADFMGVGWVAEANFIKTILYKGRKCMVFSRSSTVVDTVRPVDATPKLHASGEPAGGLEHAEPVPASSPTRQATQTALVDYDTRLPVYAQDDKINYTFEYLRPPESMLQMPEDIGKLVSQQTKVSTDMARPVPKAF